MYSLQNGGSDSALALPPTASNNSILINISAEVDQCSVWKHLHEDSQPRNRKRQLGHSQPPIPESPELPQVTIDPPSQRTSVVSDPLLQKMTVDGHAFQESTV